MGRAGLHSAQQPLNRAGGRRNCEARVWFAAHTQIKISLALAVNRRCQMKHQGGINAIAIANGFDGILRRICCVFDAFDINSVMANLQPPSLLLPGLLTRAALRPFELPLVLNPLGPHQIEVAKNRLLLQTRRCSGAFLPAPAI